MTKHEKLTYSYEVYIGAPAERVWKGLTDGELTRQYVYGTRFVGKLQAGAPYAFVGDGDFKVVDGQILEVAPEKHLAFTWAAHWDEATGKDRASRVRYELTVSGPGTTRLRVVHDDFDGETATWRGSVEGWPILLSSLKTLLETGKPLAVAGS
jgi:uncharacterized protein YndB with AHSA1/START domain